MTVAAPQKRKSRKRQKGVVQPGEMTLQALADGVGVSKTTIEKYCRRGCPRTSVKAALKWRQDNIKSCAEDADPSEIGIELKRAEMAQRWEDARAKAMKNDILSGRLIEKRKVETSLAINLTRLRNRITSLPTEIAMLCPDDLKVPMKAKVEQVIAVAFKEIVDAISSEDEDDE